MRIIACDDSMIPARRISDDSMISDDSYHDDGSHDPAMRTIITGTML